MNRFVFEFTFTGVMFCSYLIAIAFVVELVYGIQDSASQFSTLSIAIAVVLAVFSVSYALLFCFWPQKFGEFSTMFVENKFFSRMYSLMILERWATSIFLVLAMGTNLSVLLGIIINILLLISCWLLKYHKNLLDRIRFTVDITISMIILIIYMGYNLNPLDNKSKGVLLYLPILCVVLLLGVLGFNAVFMVRNVVNQVFGK